MAGAGIKRGIIHGSTDELGFHAVQDRHYVTDIHATVMHLLGLEPRRRGGQLFRRGRRERRRIVVHAVKLRRRAVDVQLENVRPVVMAGKVVPQLHLDRDFTVFGRVIGGADVLGRLIESDKIVRAERIPDSP